MGNAYSRDRTLGRYVGPEEMVEGDREICILSREDSLGIIEKKLEENGLPYFAIKMGTLNWYDPLLSPSQNSSPPIFLKEEG